MPRRGPALLAVVLAVGSLSLSGPAGAASEFGKECEAGSSSNITTVYASNGPMSQLPAGSAQSGVITRMRVTLPGGQPDQTFEVKTVRPAAGPANTFTTVSSTPVTAGSGTRTAAVRVPVLVGDRLGVSSANAVGLFCMTNDAADVLVVAPGNSAVGTTRTYTVAGTQLAVPVVAVVEPDVDKDGYGDETQDKCPQSAATQSACPVVAIDATAKASKRRITVTVTADQATTVTVGGTARKRPKTFPLSGGPTAVAPGTLGKVVVALPTKLRAAIAQLPRTKKVRAVLVLSATNLAGAPTTTRVELKLRGTAR